MPEPDTQSPVDTAALEARIRRLHAPGVVDMHFDVLMDLYEQRRRPQVLHTDHLPELRAAQVGVVGVPIFVLDGYIPEMGLRVALAQVARLYAELDGSESFALCRSYAEIERAQKAGKIALVLTMEGVDPFGDDINMLRLFYELGVRIVGLTHVRRNAAGDGAIFAPSGSSPAGLTPFGREVVRQCDALGIILDLAHINPAGFNDVLSITSRPVIVSHTDARRYYDVERNVSDEQIRAVGARGGVIGVSAAFVSTERVATHLDRYVDHVEHIAGLIGIDGVGLGLDFSEPVNDFLPPSDKGGFISTMGETLLIPGLTRYSHVPNLTRKLIERGFSDGEIEKVLFRNWLRFLAQML